MLHTGTIQSSQNTWNLKDNGNENFYWLFQSYLTTHATMKILSFRFLLEHFSLQVKCMQTLCFASILETFFEKLSRRSMNFVTSLYRWVAPKLQERILLRACYVS